MSPLVYSVEPEAEEAPAVEPEPAAVPEEETEAHHNVFEQFEEPDNVDEEVSKDKKVAIISYMTLIGAIIALVMNKDKKDVFSSVHIRQSLGLNVLWIANIIIGFFNVPYVPGVISLILLILWFYGLVGAFKGKKLLIPGLGEYFQKWFKSIVA